MRPSVTCSHEILQEYYVDSTLSIVGKRLKYVYCHLTLSHTEKKMLKTNFEEFLSVVQIKNKIKVIGWLIML